MKPATKKRARSETAPGTGSLSITKPRDPLEKVACPGGVSLEVLTVKGERFVTLRSLVAPYGKDPASTRRVLESEGYVVPRFKAPNVDGRWRDTPCIGYFQAIAVIAALDTRGMSTAEKKRLFNFRTALPTVLQKFDAQRSQIVVAPPSEPTPHLVRTLSEMVLQGRTLGALVKRVGNEFATGMTRLVELVSQGNEAHNERLRSIEAKIDRLLPEARPATPAPAPPSEPPSEYVSPPALKRSRQGLVEPCVPVEAIAREIHMHLGRTRDVLPQEVINVASRLGIWEHDDWGRQDDRNFERLTWLADQESVTVLKEAFRSNAKAMYSQTQRASSQ